MYFVIFLYRFLFKTSNPIFISINRAWATIIFRRAYKLAPKQIKRYFQKYPSITIVTGATKNHYSSALAFIVSVAENLPHCNLIFYNLDTAHIPTTVKHVCALFGYCFKTFDFSKHPSWFSIESQLNKDTDRFYAGAYGWKPNIIHYELQNASCDYLIWCDAGNLINISFEKKKLLKKNEVPQTFYELIAQGPVTAFTTWHTIKKLTHRNTVTKLQGERYLEDEMKMGGCIVLETKNGLVNDLITEWKNSCNDPDLVAPRGATFRNHRYDQAIFSILFYKYADKYGWTKHIGNPKAHITVQHDNKLVRIYGKCRYSNI